MPPRMYLRLSIQGTISTGEVWSVNPCFQFTNAFGPVWDQPSAEAIVQALLTVTVPSTLLSTFGTAVRITGYRLEGRGDDHALLGVAEAAFATPVTGSGTADKTPQSAWVASLRTDTPGASGRGRLYWPCLRQTIDATSLRMTSAAVAALTTAMSSYLTLLATKIRDNAGVFPWTGVELCVVSKTTGTRHSVRRIQGGDVIDTQRRRRDKIRESYQSASYPATP